MRTLSFHSEDGRSSGIDMTPTEAQRRKRKYQATAERARRIRLWGRQVRLGQEIDWCLPSRTLDDGYLVCLRCSAQIDLATEEEVAVRAEVTEQGAVCGPCMRAEAGPGRPKKTKRPWTPDEDRLVLTLRPAEAARRLGRSMSSVTSRWKVLDSGGRKRGRPRKPR